MSPLEETFEAIIRRVVREELAAFSNQNPELLTAGEVAKLIKKGRSAVYDLRREGKLKAIALGENSYRFPREEVLRFIREGMG